MANTPIEINTQQTGLRNSRIVQISVGLLLLFVVFVVYKKFLSGVIQEQKQKDQEGKQGSKPNEYATRLKDALHQGIGGMSEDEELILKIVAEIGNRKTFNEVATAYNNLYGVSNLEEYIVSKLDNQDQITQFYASIGGKDKNTSGGGGFLNNLLKF